MEHIYQHLTKEPPEQLYHYTSVDVLEKITETRTIWATDIYHLNDRQEFMEAFDLIKKHTGVRLDVE
jgi:hypothetical protein